MQLACFDFTKKLTETISVKMGNEGVYFLTSPNPSWDTTKTKLHLQDTARSIESFLLKTFKKKIFIGISSQTHSPQELPEAFKESVQALHLGLHIQKNYPFLRGSLSGQRSHRGSFALRMVSKTFRGFYPGSGKRNTVNSGTIYKKRYSILRKESRKSEKSFPSRTLFPAGYRAKKGFINQ